MTMPPAIPSIDVVEAERRQREDPDGPVLLDVREMDEFVTVRAPGAVLVPTSAFTDRLGDIPADRPLMVVCRTGGRSSSVVGYLVRAGRSDVVNVGGGMEAWQRAGLPTRRGALAPGEGEDAAS